MEQSRKNEPVPGRDYTVRLINLDTRVAGVTAMDEDGYASIYINSRLSDSRQKKALVHELTHIKRNDFDRSEPIAVPVLP